MNQPKTPSSTPQPDQQSNGGTSESVERLFEQVLDSSTAHPLIELLSDLDRPGAAHLRERWLDISGEQRASLVQQMAADAETNVSHSYDRAFLVAITDPEAATRLAALQGLWEHESSDYLSFLLDHVDEETDDDVRAAEAAALGRFAMQAELGVLADDNAERVRSTLLRLHTNDRALEVRRRALESLGYFAEDQEIIDLIRIAFELGAVSMRASALQAMGRQADTRWVEDCHEELRSDEPEIRFEAVTALGMIGDPRSVPDVIDLTADEDTEVQLAAIAALGAIGGQMATNALRRLEQEESPIIAEAAEDALQEAALMASPLRPLL
jgi:HEAT repeat protein